MADFYASYPISGGGGGSGDVVGPASSDNNGLVLFDGTTGKEIKQATGTGIVKVTSGVASVLADPLPVANGGTNSATALNNNRVMVSSGGAIAEAAAITASRAVVSNGSGIPVASATTATEIGYVNGVTSSIQTQLDAKEPALNPGDISTTTPGVTVGSGTNSTVGPNVTIDVDTASGAQPGLLSAADWTTFNSKQAGDATLTALAAYNTNGLMTQTAADTFTGRTVTGTADRISVSNGDGVAGNPTVDIANTYVGQNTITTLGTVTTGTWNATTIAINKGGTGETTASAAFGALKQTATASATGVVSSFFPVVASAVNIVSSANYAVLTGDGYSTILVSTANSNRTIDLPAATSNAGRIITIKKTDSGTGGVIIDPNSTETIDGFSTITLSFQYESITLVCDGSNWLIQGYPNKYYSSYYNASSVTTTGERAEATVAVPYTAIYEVIATCSLVCGSSAGNNSDITVAIKTGTTVGGASLKTQSINRQRAGSAGGVTYCSTTTHWIGSVTVGDNIYFAVTLGNNNGTGSTQDHQMTIREVRRA